MNTESNFTPFKEYPSTLSRYSDNDQLLSHQYKSILESELGQNNYEKKFNTLEKAAIGPLNSNLPRYNKEYTINVNNNDINVYKEFWQYKQPGGTIFTDWNSAGLSAIKEDMSVRNLPLYGKISDPTLVLSNTNNVRNNFQNYGKEYLTTTNMLNAEAFSNGVFYESGGTSPYRSGLNYEIDEIEHSNFKNKEDGDLYERQIKQLRVDLPINYANNNISSWNYINPILIKPNESKLSNGTNKIKVFHEQLKFGIFDLDSLKLIGKSCLTKNFGMTPQGFSEPTDVYNDEKNYPPVENINYYKPGQDYYVKNENPSLYCSENTNFVTMPINHVPRLKNLDTSFQVSPGNNSITLGTVMSPKLKDFINNDLFMLNKKIVLIQIYKQEINNMNWYEFSKEYPNKSLNEYPKSNLMRKIEKICPELFSKHPVDSMHINFHEFMGLSENNKYTYIFNMQRNFSAIYQGNPEVEIFINHLSIFKFGGNNINYPEEKGTVILKELSNNKLEILSPGIFLLLPTMMSEDLFTVKINNNNSCITPGANYQTNATNCAFRGNAGMWQQKPSPGENNPNYILNMFNDPKNYNNAVYNLSNPYVGVNPYNAPQTF